LFGLIQNSKFKSNDSGLLKTAVSARASRGLKQLQGVVAGGLCHRWLKLNAAMLMANKSESLHQHFEF
jgi:hypothetical protein